MNTIRNITLKKSFATFSPVLGTPVYIENNTNGIFECLLLSDVSGAQRLLGRGVASTAAEALSSAELSALKTLESEGLSRIGNHLDFSQINLGIHFSQTVDGSCVVACGNKKGIASTPRKALLRCFSN